MTERSFAKRVQSFLDSNVSAQTKTLAAVSETCVTVTDVDSRPEAAWDAQWNQMWPSQWNQGTTSISKGCDSNQQEK